MFIMRHLFIYICLHLLFTFIYIIYICLFVYLQNSGLDNEDDDGERLDEHFGLSKE